MRNVLRQTDVFLVLQEVEKHDAVAEKRRESVLSDLSNTKSQLGGAEAQAARLQTEKEKAQFELHAKKGTFLISDLAVFRSHT